MNYKNIYSKMDTLRRQEKFSENFSPTCLSSQKEKEKFLEKILQNLQLDYKKNYSFQDCLSPLGNRLQFDFCLLDKSSIPWRPLLLIEIQGAHHNRALYGEERFSEIILHDKIKKDFCCEKNIPLLELFGEDFKGINEKILQKKISDILKEEDWT